MGHEMMVGIIGISLQAGRTVELFGALIVAVVIVAGLYVVSSRVGGPDHAGSDYTTKPSVSVSDTTNDIVNDEDREFDITNADVQGLLQHDEALMKSLHSFAEDDDMAKVVYEGENETHYAIVDIWWMRIAGMLGYDPENYEDSERYFINLWSTDVLGEFFDRVDDLPELDNDLCDTSPFVVEHDQSYPQPPGAKPMSAVTSDGHGQDTDTTSASSGTSASETFQSGSGNSYWDENEELFVEITNDDVQRWLRGPEDGLGQLESWVEDDLARLIHEGKTESHYAVNEFWWYQLVQDLGFADPDENDEHTEFTIAIAFTDAYEEHSDRVGEVPELGDGFDTYPFLVEH